MAEQDEAANQTRWIVFGRAHQPLTLSWKRRVDDRRAGQTLRLRGRVAELVTLGEEVSPVLASVRVEVVQGVARESRSRCPKGLPSTRSRARRSPTGMRRADRCKCGCSSRRPPTCR